MPSSREPPKSRRGQLYDPESKELEQDQLVTGSNGLGKGELGPEAQNSINHRSSVLPVSGDMCSEPRKPCGSLEGRWCQPGAQTGGWGWGSLHHPRVFPSLLSESSSYRPVLIVGIPCGKRLQQLLQPAKGQPRLLSMVLRNPRDDELFRLTQVSSGS